MEKLLRESLADQALCDAILMATSPVVVCGSVSLSRQNGLPQGNGISPLLSNVYLHSVDQACSQLQYFRYADDVLVVGGSRGEAEQVGELICHQVANLGLQLNEKKTRVCDLYRVSVVFLGYELRGGNIYPPAKSILRFRKNLELGGQEARKSLMIGFVRRYRIGSVRKLFRRLDRDFRHLYPAGLSLVSLFDSMTGTVVTRGEVVKRSERQYTQ
jgi:hypothetical protein